MNYIIELNDTQLKAIRTALEEYFRLRMGQMGDLSDGLAMLPFEGCSKEELHKRFDRFIDARNSARIALDAAYRIATADSQAHGIVLSGKTETSRIVLDVWQVIRHQLWLDANGPTEMPWSVDGRKPMLESDQPMCKVRRADDNA